MCDLVEIIIILIKVIIYIYIYITTKMMMFVYSNYSSSGVLWVAPHSVAEIVACFENRVSKSTLRSYWVRVVLSPPTGGVLPFRLYILYGYILFRRIYFGLGKNVLRLITRSVRCFKTPVHSG